MNLPSRHPLNLVLFVGLMIVMAVVPLIFSTQVNNIVLPKLIVAQGGMFALFGLWLGYQIRRDDWRLPRTGVNGLIVLWMLWNVVSVLVWSEFWHFGIKELGPLLACLFGFFLMVETVNTRRRLRIALYVLVGVCLVTLVFGYLQHFNMSYIDWGREVLISTFGNKNFFGGFMALTLPVFVGILIVERHPGLRGLVVLIAAAQMYMLMLTENRTSFLAILVAAGTFLVLALIWGKFTRILRRRSIQVVLGLVVLSGIASMWLVPDEFWVRLSRAADLQEGTARVRWIMWTGSARAALEALIGGHGFGVFQLVFPYFRPSFYHRFRVSHNTRHSHNEFMEVFMETGTVGLALFLLIMVVLLVMVIRFLRTDPPFSDRYLVIALTAALVGGLAENMASVNLRWMATMFQFWLIAGMLVAVMRLSTGGGDDEPEPKGKGLSLPSLRWPWTVVAQVAIAAVVLASWGGMYSLWAADALHQRMNSEIQLAEAERIDWSRPAETGERALRFNPYHLSIYYRLGYVHLTRGQLDEAYRYYDALRSLAPNYAQIHRNFGTVYRQLGHPAASLIHHEWATDREDNRSNRLTLTGLYLHDGYREEPVRHGFSLFRLLEEDWEDRRYRFTRSLETGRFGGARNHLEQMEQMLEWKPDLLGASEEQIDEHRDALRRPGRAGVLPFHEDVVEGNEPLFEALQARMNAFPELDQETD